MQNRKRYVALGLGVICISVFLLGSWAFSEKNLAWTPLDATTDRIAARLSTVEYATSFAALDLQAVERNMRRVESTLRDRYQIRWVAKSLPSFSLLQWISEKSGSKRFMVFQKTMTQNLLQDLPGVDLLLGKPLPVQAADEILQRFPQAANQVHWLVDTESRLKEYRDLAKRHQKALSIVLEIDIGLRRGGFERADQLRAIQPLFEGGFLRMDGLMGYDGQIPYVSPLFGPGKRRAQEQEFKSAQERYQSFVDVLRSAYPEPRGGFLLNGGGSHTFWRYQAPKLQTPINEIAVGSVLVKPSHFDDEDLSHFEPALYFSVPILKEVDQPFPFVGRLGWLWDWMTYLNPQLSRGYYLYGGAWSGEIVYPKGLQYAWFHSQNIQNVLPNQQLLMGSKDVQFPYGRRVIVRPPEGDLLAAFDRIWAMKAEQDGEWWLPLGRND